VKTGRSGDQAALTPGMQLGSWRVLSQHGSGSYGIIYRVERIGQEQAGPFALKLARHPLDPRFDREWQLLSRIRHAHVPRFEIQGWLSLGGNPFPYIVMEWVEGTPLYAWAAQQPRTSRQVMCVLAQVARTLEATYAEEAVHRDVKGDNVLVRTRDGTAVLMDFGSGNFRGAPILTREPPPPGTERYWSPECLRFQWKWRRHPTMRYEAGPADDLYALGVMAYRLINGVYPHPAVNFVETEEDIQLVEAEPVPAEPRVKLSPELAALIARLLSNEPAARGSAGEVAQALERAADRAGPDGDLPFVPVTVAVQVPIQSNSQPVLPTSVSTRSPWRAVSLGMLLVLLAWWIAPRPSVDEPRAVVEKAPPSGTESRGDKADAGPVGLGDNVRSAPASAAPLEPVHSGISKRLPDKPLPSQRLRPCEKPEVEINGGCWVHWVDVSPPCGARFYEWKNKCYSPILEPPRSPTSDPQ